jgi:hypothetical protein
MRSQYLIMLLQGLEFIHARRKIMARKARTAKAKGQEFETETQETIPATIVESSQEEVFGDANTLESGEQRSPATKPGKRPYISKGDTGTKQSTCVMLPSEY